MTHEVPLSGGYQITPDITLLQVVGDEFSSPGADPVVFVWRVPAFVDAITILINGAGAWNQGGDRYGTPGLALFDVAVTPGEEWLLEPGRPSFYYNPIAPASGQWHGGDGGGDASGLGHGYGTSGGGASTIGRRGSYYAVAGGRGGAADYRLPGGFVHVAPTVGAVSTWSGAPGSPGLAPGEDAGVFSGAGGGGGGAPRGSAGAAVYDAGETGGSYIPAGSAFGAGASMGGPVSPTWADLGEDGSSFYAGAYYGGVSILYFTPPVTSAEIGWIVGHIPMFNPFHGEG